ncbi:hypothetical protein, partial [Muribaculum intestinale]|uniref:hypothetical protein n=1 Tax=Muribaculum intestinale TaxID=1796646 RepID=UPI00241FF5CD
IPSPEGERRMTNAHLKVLHFDLESSAQNEGFSEWERTSDPVRVAISEFSKHTLTLENSLVELKL